MRPAVLEHGYQPDTKLLFALIRFFSGHPLPDAAKLTFYHRDFYGNHTKAFTHKTRRGPSTWPVGDCELMAAYISKIKATHPVVGAPLGDPLLGTDSRAPREPSDPQSTFGCRLRDPAQAHRRSLNAFVERGNRKRRNHAMSRLVILASSRSTWSNVGGDVNRCPYFFES